MSATYTDCAYTKNPPELQIIDLGMSGRVFYIAVLRD